MNKTYDEFIKSCGVISENDFNELIKSLPDVDINFNNIIWNDPYDITVVITDIVSEILLRWNFCWVDDFNIENKSIELSDVDSIKDLKEIEELFYPNWKISNYEELMENCKENQEINLYNSKLKIIKNVIDNISLEEIKEIANKYEKR